MGITLVRGRTHQFEFHQNTNSCLRSVSWLFEVEMPMIAVSSDDDNDDS